MGMAAGQARFLGLTARKTNVEYEGQQINQQRTTLANQSASYNNQLLGMNVPTPPSTDNFTKTTYSWTQDDSTMTISNVTPNKDASGNNIGTYTVKYTTPVTQDLALAKGLKPVERTGTAPNYAYSVNGYSLTLADTAMNSADRNNTDKITTTFFPSPATPPVAYYKYTSSTGKTMYLTKEAIDKAVADGTQAQTYDVESVTTKQENKLTNAKLTWDNGRMTSIALDANIDPTAVTLAVNSETDQAAYTNAMNDYEYQKAQYEKQMNDINSQISVIQDQDRTLEIKLKQCDTEQQAISTELDAVKKVIDKNVESTFKTFG